MAQITESVNHGIADHGLRFQPNILPSVLYSYVLGFISGLGFARLKWFFEAIGGGSFFLNQ